MGSCILFGSRDSDVIITLDKSVDCCLQAPRFSEQSALLTAVS